MTWNVEFHDALVAEFGALPSEVKVALAGHVELLKEIGPELGRPHADTLKGSRHANMKELRVQCAGGVWRLAFAFDPRRSAILLVGGDKAGVSEKRFYRTLIATADERLDDHLAALKTEE